MSSSTTRSKAKVALEPWHFIPAHCYGLGQWSSTAISARRAKSNELLLCRQRLSSTALCSLDSLSSIGPDGAASQRKLGLPPPSGHQQQWISAPQYQQLQVPSMIMTRMVCPRATLFRYRALVVYSGLLTYPAAMSLMEGEEHWSQNDLVKGHDRAVPSPALSSPSSLSSLQTPKTPIKRPPPRPESPVSPSRTAVLHRIARPPSPAAITTTIPPTTSTTPPGSPTKDGNGGEPLGKSIKRLMSASRTLRMASGVARLMTTASPTISPIDEVNVIGGLGRPGSPASLVATVHTTVVDLNNGRILERRTSGPHH
ncbi:hypothetical protein BC828DRAFT_392769 [Blastocladiella britannica]|nr:hypothetical protein BC828DRAFT_392769 [Blastocladiella britannica]